MKLMVCLFIITITSYGQQVTEVATLTSEIKETSGLIYLNQKLITHNDSGGEAALYEIDSVTGNFTRKVVISNAENIDWEDICHDDTYIYIGDFGNNLGSRTDLKIYRILIADYLTSVNDTVAAETISFNYDDQIDFTPMLFSTNFDAEALISYNDSLYVFTKNWSNFQTNIYAIPKTIGVHQIVKIDNINSQGLVTGATYNSIANTIILTGYDFFSAFIVEIHQIASNKFSDATIERYPIQLLGSFQIESIAPLNNQQYYFTSEESTSGSSKLYRLNAKDYLSVTDITAPSCFLYPNPASDVLTIQYDNLSKVEFYDTHGILQKVSNKQQIDISDLSRGLYFVFLRKKGAGKTEILKLIVE